MAERPLSSASTPAQGRVWLTLEQMAEVLGTSYENVAGKVSRRTLPAHLFPSERHRGKQITRIPLDRLEPALQREAQRYLARFGELGPDACLAQIESQLGAAAVKIARERYEAVRLYSVAHPKTVLAPAGARNGRIDSPAVIAVAQRVGVEPRTLQRWATAFDRAIGDGATPEDLHRGFLALVPRTTGRVRNPAADRRLKLGLAEQLAIQGMHAIDAQPPIDTVWRDVIRCCPRCKQAAMNPVDGGFRGRYKQHTCASCGFSLSYATVRRIVHQTPTAPALLARHGAKAYDDKFARYAQRDWSGIRRSEVVFGDHHECDIEVYDPRRLTGRDGAPFLFRPWLSAWQDIATDVVAYVIDRRANGQLLGLAYRRYVSQFGAAEFAWTDNGLDYLGQDFAAICAAIGTKLRRCLPSRRGAESHAKSKPIEKWFGTLEQDCIQRLPGWLGHNIEQRQERDGVLHRMHQQHLRWVETREGASPFLSIEQFREEVARWVENVFHKLPVRRLDRAPLVAFRSDSYPLRTVPERVLDLLLLKRKPRVVGPNGVELDGLTYWSQELFGHEGEPCEVRCDPQDRSNVVVILAGRAIVAYTNRPAGWSQEDIQREAQLKRQQRQVINDALHIRQAMAAGFTPFDQVMAEKAAEPAAPAREAVNCTPVVTPYSGVADQLARRSAAATSDIRHPTSDISRVRAWQFQAEDVAPASCRLDSEVEDEAQDERRDE